MELVDVKHFHLKIMANSISLFRFIYKRKIFFSPSQLLDCKSLNLFYVISKFLSHISFISHTLFYNCSPNTVLKTPITSSTMFNWTSHIILDQVKTGARQSQMEAELSLSKFLLKGTTKSSHLMPLQYQWVYGHLLL